jgi:hypothetical protein
MPQEAAEAVLVQEHIGAEQAEHKCAVRLTQLLEALAEQVAAQCKVILELAITKLMEMTALLTLVLVVVVVLEYLGVQLAATVVAAAQELLLFATN